MFSGGYLSLILGSMKKVREKMSKFGPGSYYDYLGFCIAEDAINRNKGGGDPGGNGSGCLSVLVIVAIIGGIIWKMSS